jgi:poly-gamma-glutamate synthase PgsB/CapB
MWLVFLLVAIYAAYALIEYRRHMANIRQIAVRIHVNGTRGKSSVTRLIGGGLKGGGKRVFIKTTGTSPRTIDIHGNEASIKRVGSANIIEQLKITRQAVAQKAEYFVVECMALFPDLQEISEKQMIRSQVGVITNIREDHLDVMGPTVDNVADALCNTIPGNGFLFTSEQRFIDKIKTRAAAVGARVIQADTAGVTSEDMQGFSYLEHNNNVALALAVCDHFGVDKKAALQGMYVIQPDPGALRKFAATLNGKSIEFVNAFAANDPDSYREIWKMLHIHLSSEIKLFVIVNSRRDRVQRAEQLGEFIARELQADQFIISGEATYPLHNRALKCGLPAEKIKDLGGKSAGEIFNYIYDHTTARSMVIGIGNIVGLGEEIANYFINKGRMVA